MPGCSNIFIKVGKSSFCKDHSKEEIRSFINHKYYAKSKYGTSSEDFSFYKMCEIPGCNNIFVKSGKSIFCKEHSKKEIKKYINHKYYMRHRYNLCTKEDK